jgi:hypothetical protein
MEVPLQYLGSIVSYLLNNQRSNKRSANDGLSRGCPARTQADEVGCSSLRSTAQSQRRSAERSQYVVNTQSEEAFLEQIVLPDRSRVNSRWHFEREFEA